MSKNPLPNQLLFPEQVEAALKYHFVNAPVKILKTIAKTGKYRQGTAWVYLLNETTQEKRASFVSTQDILEGFWRWYQTLGVMAMALWQQIAVGKVIWSVVAINEKVYHPEHGWGTVVEKDFSVNKGIPRLWVEFRSSDALHHFLPTELQYT